MMEGQMSEEEINLKKLMMKQFAEIENQLAAAAEERASCQKAVPAGPRFSLKPYDGRWFAFVKRVKKLGIYHESKLTLAGHESKVLDLPNLFVKEAANAIIMKANLRETDAIDLAIKICVNLRKKHLKFPEYLLEAWKAVFSLDDNQKVADPIKIMDLLPFYVKLITFGVISPEDGLSLVGTFLANLVGLDQQQEHFINAPIILAICGACVPEFAGLTSLKLMNDAAQFGLVIPKRDGWLLENQRLNTDAIFLYHSLIYSRMVQAHVDFLNLKSQNENAVQEGGLLSAEWLEQEAALEQNFTNLNKMARDLSDMLEVVMPDPSSYLPGFLGIN